MTVFDHFVTFSQFCQFCHFSCHGVTFRVMVSRFVSWCPRVRFPRPVPCIEGPYGPNVYSFIKLRGEHVYSFRSFGTFDVKTGRFNWPSGPKVLCTDGKVSPKKSRRMWISVSQFTKLLINRVVATVPLCRLCTALLNTGTRLAVFSAKTSFSAWLACVRVVWLVYRVVYRVVVRWVVVPGVMGTGPVLHQVPAPWYQSGPVNYQSGPVNYQSGQSITSPVSQLPVRTVKYPSRTVKYP